MKNILLQGLPGVGKTTIIKKLANALQTNKIETTGFYTEEVRDSNNYRAGFDIVTLNNERGILARKGGESKYKVGSYSVHLEDFENIAIPTFNNVNSLIIIDEVGKMELFSKKFHDAVEKVISDPSVTVIATVPLKWSNALVQKLKEHENSKLITVTPKNRDNLLNEILLMLES